MHDDRTAASLADAIAAAKRHAARAGYPLGVAANGQWCKKVRGKRVTFGSVLQVTPDEAAARYHAWAADLAAGRDPRPVDGDAATVGLIFETFAARQIRRAQAGTIKDQTASRQVEILRWAARALDHRLRVANLSPSDFTRLRDAADDAGWAPATITHLVGTVRSAFSFAADEQAIDRLPAYGGRFKRPSKAEVRRYRARRGIDGRRAFSRDEVRAFVTKANPLLRACVLLGISGGMLGAEIAALRHDQVGDEWITTARPKTGIPRRIPVWPEVRRAIDDWKARDNAVRDAASAPLLFVTRHGLPLVRHAVVARSGAARKTLTDSVGQAFDRLLIKTEVRVRRADAPGLGFSMLRRTFATVASGKRDRLATAVIMGHAVDADVDDSYVDSIDDTRLLEVSHRVRSWLAGDIS
ncbi:MAG: tyrosine-type recombinase/integrase [Phycisphaerales bacterium]